MRNFFVFAAIVLTACTSSNTSLRNVSESDYASDNKCWFRDDGKFTSFVIIEERDRKYAKFPPFSAMCYVLDAQENDVTINYLGTPAIASDRALFNKFTNDKYTRLSP